MSHGFARGCWTAALSMAIFGLGVARAAEVEPGRLSGLAYADYFYDLQGAGQENNAFRFRRIYFTYDRDLDSTIAARLQLEMNDENLTSSGRMGPFVKQAYLAWKIAGPVGTVFAGLSATPLWTQAETVWGYRSIEKTILDLHGIGFPTDIGVAVRRDPSRDRTLGWHVMFANGNGTRPENDRSKKVYLSIPVRVDALIVEGVGDYEGGPGSGAANRRDRYTLKLLAGWMGSGAALGVEAFRRVNRNDGVAGADVTPTGVSLFGRCRARGSCSLFARYDYFDPDSQIEGAGYRQQLVITGLDYAMRPNVHLMPNLWIDGRSPKGDAPDLDTQVTARLTLFYSYP